MPPALLPTCCLSFRQEHMAVVQGVNSLTRERICAGKWQRKESLGCLRRPCSPYINRNPGSSISSAVGNSCTSVPAGGHAPVSLHIDHGEPGLCPRATQTPTPAPALCYHDISSAKPSCTSTAGPSVSPDLPSPLCGSAPLPRAAPPPSSGTGALPRADSVGDLPCL